MGEFIGSARRPNGRVTGLLFEALTVGLGHCSPDSWIVMFTTAVQVGPNGSHDLPIPFPKSQCVRLNSRRPVYEVGLRPREMLAHLTGSASGSHVRHEGERFAPRTFVPPGLGSLTEEPTCPSPDSSGKLTNYEMRLGQRLTMEQT